MSAAPVSCVKCRAPLPGSLLNIGELTACPGCSRLLEVEVFPALFRRIARGQTGEAVVSATDSSCFFHPEKKAVVPCQACGRFLCALCDCELDGLHLCPNCLDAGKKKGKIKSLENHRVLYDSAALALSIAPLIIFYLTIVTAPLALYLSIRHWKTPSSIIHRTKIRFIIAVLLASLQVIGWVVVFFALATLRPKR